MTLRCFAIIYIVSLAVRLPMLVSIAGDPDRAIQDDSRRYWELADNLRQYRTLGMAEEEYPWRRFHEVRDANGTRPPADANGLRPEGFRTPGYPLLVAACQTIWRSMTMVVLVQVLLAGVTACLIASAAYRFSGSRRGAWIAGLGWALHPGIIFADANVLTESTFSLGVATTVWFLSRSSSTSCLYLGAALASLVPMFRPFGVFLAVPVVLMALRQPRRRWLHAALTGLIAIAPTLAWSARNQAKGEGFRLCTVGDLTMYYYFSYYVECEQQGKDWRETWPADFAVRTDRLREHAQPGDDVYRVAGKLARDQVTGNPTITAKILAKSQFKLWFAHSLGDAHRAFGLPYQPSGLMAALILGENRDTKFQASSLLALAWTGLNAIIFGLMLWASVKAVRRRQWALLFCCATVIALSAAGTMCVGQERFRIPMMVPVLILIGGSWRPSTTAARNVA